ncbi:hypothetical protein [Massilia orientalis]|uniref:Uncharacterized protein n=1 Tax=Massilia orientalis TaxID=3050128 RepID=A0ACC7MDD2_9BURK|nr:hypothetical protein [Massilia sp. YIM B02787]
MFDKNITPAEYKHIFNARADLVRQLLIEALRDRVPAGYVLSADRDRMYGDALLALRPLQVAKGMKMICFTHAINYRSSIKEGEVIYRPTVEFLRACADEKGATLWGTDPAFGENGRMEFSSADAGDLGAMVRAIAAQVCSFAPFTDFEWRRCAHDDGGKWELLDGERCLQTVWKSGSRYGTLMGTCPSTLATAKAEAEAAARFMIACEHQERLAGLADGLVETSVPADDEEVCAPTI